MTGVQTCALPIYEHNIIPQSVVRKLKDKVVDTTPDDIQSYDNITDDEIELIIADLENQMQKAAADLEFEKAAKLRDQIMKLKEE